MLGKWLLMSLGVLAMVVGLIGVVVPLLPTTPFLLLAAACFVRSSDTMYGWLTSNRLFGGFIRDYREQRGVSARAKIMALVAALGRDRLHGPDGRRCSLAPGSACCYRCRRHRPSVAPEDFARDQHEPRPISQPSPLGYTPPT